MLIRKIDRENIAVNWREVTDIETNSDMNIIITFTFLLAIGQVVGDCGRSQYDSKFKVVNGEKTRRHAWPWIVSILQDGFTGCIGTIVHKRWILTAAHCFFETAKPDAFYVTTGEYSKDENSAALEIYKVDKIYVHRDYDFYDAMSPNDIALMHLAYDVRFDNTAKQICLPDSSMTFDEKSPDCYVAGWGTSEGTSDNEQILHQAQDKIVNQRQCDLWYRGAIKDSMICFGPDDKKTCAGDSGAPLMCNVKNRWVQAGLFSWGTKPCTAKDRPAVMTRVSSFLDWMRAVMTKHVDTDTGTDETAPSGGRK